jgi:hypothetical protein
MNNHHHHHSKIIPIVQNNNNRIHQINHTHTSSIKFHEQTIIIL